jgi:hypothetical protein
VPTVTINQKGDQGDPSDESTVDFTVVFSEPVTGFATGDVTLGGTAGATTATVTAVDGANYDVAVTGMTSDGTVIATVAAAAAADAAGNANTASTSTDNTVTYDTTDATFDSLTATSGSTTVTATFSEPLDCTTVLAVDFLVTVNSLPTTVSSVTCTAPSDATVDLVLGAAPDETKPVSVTLVGLVDDTAGNTTTGPSAKMATPPAITVDTADNASTNDTTPTFTGSASDTDGIAAVQVKVDGGSFSTSGVTGTTSWSFTPGSTLSAGLHTFVFRSLDNGGSVSSQVTRNRTVDLTAPTVTIDQAAGQDDPTRTDPISFDVMFSEGVNGFTGSDVTISGTAGGIKSVAVTDGTDGDAAYTIEVSGMTDGTVIASVNASAAQDAAGNNSAASTSSDNTVTYDTTGPTVTINQKSDQPDPTNVSPIRFTVTFSEPVTGLATEDISLSGGAQADTAVVSGSGTTYTITVSGMTGSGSVIASVDAAAATDAAGNDSVASTSTDNTVTYDVTVPSVTINQRTALPTPQSDPTNTLPIDFTVVFSEAVTGFTETDVALTGSAGFGAATVAVTGGGTTYNVAVSGVTSAAPGGNTVTASIPTGVATDTAGNGNDVSTSTDNTVTYDPNAPTVTINQKSDQEDPSDETAIDFTAQFSEDVTDFDDAGDVTAGGDSGGSKAVTITAVDGDTYTVTVTLTSPTDGTVTAVVNANAAKDAAQNDNVGSTSTDNTVTYDDTDPVFDSIGPVGDSRIVVADFNELLDCDSVGVTDFTATVDSLPRAVTGADCVGSSETVDIELAIPNLDSGDTVAVTLVNGAVTDVAGNTSATAPARTNDVPAISVDTGDNASTYDTTPQYTGAASDTSGGTIAEVQVSVDGGAYSTEGVTTTDAWVTWTFEPEPSTPLAAGNHTLAFRSKDNLSGFSSPVSRTVTIDTTPPTVTINQKSDQEDPTDETAIDFTVQFSETVTDFDDAADVTVGGTSVGTKTITISSVDGATYTVTVTLTGTPTDGTVTAVVNANAAKDAAENDNAGSTSTDNTVIYDDTEPTVTINKKSDQEDPTDETTVDFTAQFSETVTGFAADDVTAGGGAGGDKTVTVTPVDGDTYTVTVTLSGTVTNPLSDGTVIASVSANGATDAAGNGNAASTSTDNTVIYDDTDPTVTVNQQATGQSDPTKTSPILFTAQFSEDVFGFATGDVTLSGTAGATTATVTAVDDSTYTITVSGMTSDGTVIAAIAANEATDEAGNGNAASTSTDNTVTYDTTAPTVTIDQATGQPDPSGTGDTSIDFTVVFSETVTGFTNDDVTWSGTADFVTGPASIAVTGTGPTYTVTVTDMIGTSPTGNTVIVAVSANAADDLAGNHSAASTSTDNAVTYDQTAPVFQRVSPQGGSTSVIVRFSEPLACSSVAVTDFTVTVATTTIPRPVTAADCTTPSDDTVELTLSTPNLVADDIVTVTVAADAVTDPAGNTTGGTATTSANTVPAITVNATPSADNSTTVDNTPTYTGTADDAGVLEGETVASVQVSVDGGAFSATGVTGTETWSFTPASALADGAHTLVFRALDDEDGTSPTVTRSITIDTTSPVLTSISAVGGDTEVTATFSEALSCTTVSDPDFTATIASTAVTVSMYTCEGTSDSTIRLVLASAPSTGQTVAVTLVGTVTDVPGNTAATPQTRSAPAA